MREFARRAHLVDEVVVEMRGPIRAAAHLVVWFTEEHLILDEDLQLFTTIRESWGSQPGKDRGEAASIVLAHRNGWRLVLDERVGYRRACDLGIAVTRTPYLLIGTVRAGWWTAEEAWRAFSTQLGSELHLGPIPWSSADEFRALCAVATYDPPRR